MALAYRRQQASVAGAEIEEPTDPFGKSRQQHLLGEEPVRYLTRQVLGDSPRFRPLLRAASHSRKRTPLASRTQQPLDDQDIPPGAVESSVAAMQADRCEAAAFDQSKAGDVVGKELADHLVEAAVLAGRGKCFGERGADATTPGGSVDVDAALPRSRRNRDERCRGEPRPANDPSAHRGHQQRKTRIVHTTTEITRGPRLRLERRPPLSDRSVVDIAHPATVIAGGATHNGFVNSDHARIFGLRYHFGNGPMSKPELALSGQKPYIAPVEPTTSAKTRRIEIRMTDEERDLEQAAAAAQGQTLSEFVRQAARREAEQVLAERTSIVLNPDEASRFLAALDDPASFEAGLGALTERPSVLGG